MYKSIKNRSGTTKKIGDTLEDLTEYLFNLCSIFKAAGIRTSTNQIDCCVRNRMYLKYGILDCSKQFKVKIVVNKDYCMLKFTEYTMEEDIVHVLFSLIGTRGIAE